MSLRTRLSGRPRSGMLTLAAVVVAPALVLTACGGGTSGAGADSPYGFETVEQEEGSPLTVWVDASRQPAVDAFTEAHPDIPVTVETYDGGANGSGTFQTKITAFDQAGSGWPDVVFSTQNNDAAWAAVGQTPFAAPLAFVDVGLGKDSDCTGLVTDIRARMREQVQEGELPEPHSGAPERRR